jgi:hypothetical protein
MGNRNGVEVGMNGTSGESKYCAHSDPDGRLPNDPAAQWQPLAVHLRQVAALAQEFAREAGAGDTLIRRARALGLLHDIGKYSPDFQKLLRGEVKRAPHSDFGAALAGFEGDAPFSGYRWPEWIETQHGTAG